ncbi:MAG: asparaginase [Clostridiales bacterium]|jgi:L-asparaginase|nr:asparaginase [Clostridiales bacterium]
MPSKNCNIALITTGGTISARNKNGVLFSGAGLLQKTFGGAFYKTSSPFNVLSENLDLDGIDALRAAVAATLADGACGGIAITHGTDTLAYSAAALAVLLGRINKPVVFVSAARPLDDPLSNGFVNMAAALKFIRRGCAGVYAAWQNPREKVKIHAAARLYYTRADGYVWSFADAAPAGRPNAYAADRPVPRARADASVPAESPRVSEGSRKVMLVRPYPGFDYRALNGYLVKNGGGAVFDPFHSGTVKTDGADSVNAVTVPCFLAAGFKRGILYESQTKLAQNIRPVFGVSPIALYYKAAFSVHMDGETRIKYVEADTVGEFFDKFENYWP